MNPAAALKVAIDLMQLPSQVRRIRLTPLPDDVLFLLRIVAGDEAALREATESARLSREVVRDAAIFFVEQILLFPDADSYRVLGARPEATNGELRRNMALLLQWLHPDLDGQGERSVFASRVTRAWNDLKTQERRTAYDRSKRLTQIDTSLAQSKRPRKHRHNAAHSNFRRDRHPRSRGWEGLLQRMLQFLFDRTAH